MKFCAMYMDHAICRDQIVDGSGYWCASCVEVINQEEYEERVNEKTVAQGNQISAIVDSQSQNLFDKLKSDVVADEVKMGYFMNRYVMVGAMAQRCYV